VGAALPIVTLPLITRALPPAEYGAWVLAYAYGSFVSGIANFAMPLAYERNFYEYREKQGGGGLLWSTLSFVLAMFALGFLVTWLWREPLAKLVTHSPTNGKLLFWTTCAVGVASIKTYFLTYFRNVRDSRSFAWFSVDESILSALMTVVMVAILKVGPLGLAWGPLFASSVVLTLLVVRFLHRLPVVFDASALRASLALSLPLLPRILIGVFGTQFDKLAVGAVASVGGAAVYAIGQKLANAVFAIATALENIFQPKTYRLMFDGGIAAGPEVGRMLTPFAYITALMALLITLGAPEILAVLAPGSYQPGAAVTAILAFHYALMFLGKQPQLLYAKRTDLIAYISIGSLVVNTSTTWALASRYGATGAALGTALAGAATLAVHVSVSQRFYRIGYERGRLLLTYGLYAVMAALTVVLAGTNVAWAWRVGARVLMLLVFLAVGARTGALAPFVGMLRQLQTRGAKAYQAPAH
jgi:PST family polysaccharide transporter